MSARVERRRILMVGVGAIGGIYGAHLSKVADVTGLDANTAHVDAINRNGLRLTGATECVGAIKAVDRAELLRGSRFDAVIILVKSQLTETAFASIKGVLSGTPLLVTMQNGMGNVEALAAATDWPIAHGVSTEAGRYAKAGEIVHLIHGGDTWLGPFRGSVEQVQWLADLMSAAGLPTRFAADPRGAIWSKFIFNCVQNPVGAIVLGVNRARFEVAEVRDVIDAMFAEGIRVAEAQGITLAFDPMSYVKKVRAGELPITKHAGSMAADIEAGRETELDALTGYLVRKANELGIAVPVTETVYRLAKGVEMAARVKREDTA